MTHVITLPLCPPTFTQDDLLEANKKTVNVAASYNLVKQHIAYDEAKEEEPC